MLGVSWRSGGWACVRVGTETVEVLVVDQRDGGRPGQDTGAEERVSKKWGGKVDIKDILRS